MAEKHFCDLTWKIENFNYCRHQNLDKLHSEEFVFSSEDQTSWNLAIFPKQLSDSMSNIITIFLERNIKRYQEDNDSDESTNETEGTADEDEDVKLKYEFSIWSKTLNRWRFIINETVSFVNGATCLKMGYIWKHWLENDIQDLLAGNVLNVRFKITSVDNKFSQSTQVKLRTCLPVEKNTFNWDIDEFLSLKSDDLSSVEKKVELKSLSIALSYLTMYGEKGLKVSLLSTKKTKSFSIKFKAKIHITSESFVLSNEDISSLPFEKFYKPLITWDKLIEESSKYVIEDTLSLDVELCIISHQLKHFVEYVYIGSSDQSSLWYRSIDAEPSNENLPKKGSSQTQVEDTDDDSLKKDILLMHKNKIMTDYFVKVDSQMIPAHSSILSARSKVFHEMVKMNMSDSEDDVLKIDHFSVDTVKRMLDYIYTDDTGELDLNTAKRLYSVSTEYEVRGLQKKTAKFLLQKMTVSNVCEILELADLYSDDDLKSNIVRFIAKNEKSVICSDDFKQFLKHKSQLAVQVFVALSEIRMK